MIFARNRGWIGIDIGSHTVKLVQTVRLGGRIELAEALVVRRTEAWPEAIADSPQTVSSTEEIAAGLSLASDFKGRSAAVALPMTLCDVRPCSVEPASEPEMLAQVARELEPVLGNIASTREYEFWSVAERDDQSVSENSLAASITQDWAQQVARDLSAARLVGQVLDVLPMALARAVELAAPGSTRSPVIVVDWGYRRATLCAIHHGRPLFVRCLRDAGFANVSSALMKALILSGEESQKLLAERGVLPRDGSPADELQSVIEEVTLEPLNVFVDELRRTLGFLRQHRRGLAASKLVLFGGGAAIRNIEGFLAEQIELDVDKWSLDAGVAASRARIPIELLGPAVALSSLAWSKA